MTNNHSTTPVSSTASTAPVTHGRQVLSFKGLRFNAKLGILPKELEATQPIEVNAQLNLGPQPVAPLGDDICNVLDYRKVREKIIETCTARHSNLLESLTGAVAYELLKLPGIIGARVQIVKLEVFEDCEVAIQIEAGQW